MNQLRKKIENYSYGLNDHLDLCPQGNIFKGINQLNQEKVAIKVVDLKNRTPEFVKEYLNGQIEALKKLVNPNIIECFDIYSTVNNCYIITQFCNQGDLQNRLKTRNCFKESQAISIFRDIFNGFNHLSQQKFIHGNLKPSCLLIKDNVIKISGFSNCRKVGKDMLREVKFNQYQSPESVKEGIFNHKSDIWSLCLLLYVMLHGKFPWQFTNKNQLLQQYTKPYQLDNDLNQDTKQFIKKGLTAKQNRITFQQLSQQPFIKRIIDNSNFNGEKYVLGLITKEVADLRLKKDIQLNMLARTEKQIISQINWMRYLLRLSDRLSNYPEQTNTQILKFIVIKQVLTQYEQLKKAFATGQNTFGFAVWRDFLQETAKMNKYRQLVKKYEIRNQKLRGPFVRLIDKLSNVPSAHAFLNDNLVLSEFNCMVAVKYSIEEIQKLWNRITKEYPVRGKYEKETPFKFKAELLLLDFLMTYYQLNCLLIDDFHRLDYFQKMSKLDIIIQFQPAEVDLTHLLEFQQKLTQLTILS